MGSYIPSTGEERQAMLQAIGLTSTDQLFDVVPESVRVKSLDLPEGLSELEVGQKMAELAAKNRVFPSVFRGAGAYRHYIPSIVKTVTSKEEFLTAYTPYQAEISQGVLQGTFEFQTMICELTGMDVSNASHYDTATSSPPLSNPLPRARSLSPATPPIRRKSARAFCRARLNSRP